MSKVDIAGLKVDATHKQELLDTILVRVKANQKTWITTVYSEFLYAALRDHKIMEMLNKADIAVADGIGIFWAKKFLEIPLTATSIFGKITQAIWQIIYSLGAIIFKSSWIKSALPEKIVGADLVYDLAKLAAKNNFSMYFLGGLGDIPKLAAKKINEKLRDDSTLLKGRSLISHSNKNPDDSSVIEGINEVNPDILLVAYGPIKQEKWITENLSKLNTKVVVGVGGSFDYIAGTKAVPPKFIRAVGLEWLWRLITQPYRYKRIIQATFGLISELMLHKIFINLSYRKNVACVILNNKNQVLIVQRNPHNPKNFIDRRNKNKYVNYWQFPQGGLDFNESIEQGALRESREETGLRKIQLIKISERTHKYDFSPAWKRLFDKNYSFKGQKQNIVYLRHTDDQEPVEIDNEELINYRWVDIKHLIIDVHPERLPLVNIVLDDFDGLTQ